MFVGNSATGLSAAQLGQIEFVNPSGFPPGRYAAQLLPTGELVPTQQTALSFSALGNRLLLTWPGGLILQGATNVSGPYADVRSANSPFIAWSTNAPQQFFRLRH
jgi:hypothetical protein